MYSDAVLDHFQSPRNAGEMAKPDAEAEEENQVCGDRLHVWLRIEGETVVEMTWKAEGCAPAIAAASATSELVPGMTLRQAAQLDREMIMEALGGLPARKTHAAMLAASVVRRAVQSYRPA